MFLSCGRSIRSRWDMKGEFLQHDARFCQILMSKALGCTYVRVPHLSCVVSTVECLATVEA